MSEKPRPSVDDVLATPPEMIAAMISDLRARQQLSALVHDLNVYLLDGPPGQKRRAEQALATLGFVAI